MYFVFPITCVFLLLIDNSPYVTQSYFGEINLHLKYPNIEVDEYPGLTYSPCRTQ